MTYQEKILPYLNEDFCKWLYETAIQNLQEETRTRNPISFICRKSKKGNLIIKEDYISPTRKDLEDLMQRLSYKFRDDEFVYTSSNLALIDDDAINGVGLKPLLKFFEEVHNDYKKND